MKKRLLKTYKNLGIIDQVLHELYHKQKFIKTDR